MRTSANIPMMSQYMPTKETSAAVVRSGAVRSIKPRMIPAIPWSQKSHQLFVPGACKAGALTSPTGICGDATGLGCGKGSGTDSGDTASGDDSPVSTFDGPAASAIVPNPLGSLTRWAKSYAHTVNL